MSLYFVDFENVHDSGINGVTGLTENDEILIFYSMKSEHMSFDTHVSIMQSPAKVKYIKLRRSAKNYLDFQLVTHLGFVIGSGMPGPYYIISKDTGYDSVVDYWKDHGVTILRQPSIGYNRTQRKATGQAPVHQTPPAQVLIKDGNTIKEYQVPSIHFSSDSRSDENSKASGPAGSKEHASASGSTGTARDADASGTSSNRNAARDAGTSTASRNKSTSRDASTSDDSSTINILEALGIAETSDTSDFSSTSKTAFDEDTAELAEMPFTSDDTDAFESSPEHSDAAPQTDDHETELIMAFPENVDVPAQSGSQGTSSDLSQESSQDVDFVMTQEESMEASQESIPEDSLESSAEVSKSSQEKKSRSSRNRRNNARKKSAESSSAQADKSQSENTSKEEANSKEETNSKEGANSREQANSKERVVSKEGADSRERANSKERVVSKESDTSGKAAKDGKTSAKAQQSDVDGIPGEVKITPQTLPESYRKKVRTALRGKNLPSAYYSSIYKAIINSYDKLALNNLLVKTFGNSKGGEIYNLIRDIFTDYQSVLG